MASPAERGPSLLGVGLYTAGEAERLIRVPSRRIRRWLTGRTLDRDGQGRRSAPLWQPQLRRVGPEVELGFRDLMELRFVDAFEKAGVSLHAIRRTLAIASASVGDPRPFSTARFRTDGRAVFLQVPEETGEHTLLDLSRRQHAFNQVVEPSFRDLDLEDGVTVRWWPASRGRDVVVDPERNFGHPVAARSGVPTRALADAVAAEGSAGKVARLYGLPQRSVRDAVEFERRLAA